MYAASIMFGYFVRRVDRRFQLERSLGMLADDKEEAVARLERLFSNADEFEIAEDPDSVPSSPGTSEAGSDASDGGAFSSSYVITQQVAVAGPIAAACNGMLCLRGSTVPPLLYLLLRQLHKRISSERCKFDWPFLPTLLSLQVYGLCLHSHCIICAVPPNFTLSRHVLRMQAPPQTAPALAAKWALRTVARARSAAMWRRSTRRRCWR